MGKRLAGGSEFIAYPKYNRVMTCLSLIAAVARNGVIGRDNTLPWHLPEDLKRFRALTTGHHIIMGRKTYESINRLLPGRTTVIVTRNPDYRVPGALVATSLRQALALCGNDEEAFLIGGAELFKEGLRQSDRVYLTEIDADFEGDVYMPPLDPADWRETLREKHVSGQGWEYSYINYERNR